MTKIHEEFPQKDEWVTESSGGTWQTGTIFADEAAELIAVMRNWSRSYVLGRWRRTRITGRWWAVAIPAAGW